MSPPVITALLGTQEGIFQVDEKGVTPLSTDLESVTALLALPDGELMAGCSSGHVYRSDQGRRKWGAVAATNAPVAQLFLQPSSPPAVLVGTDAEVLRSIDGGRTFSVAEEFIGPPGPGPLPTTFAASPRQPRTVLAVHRGGALLRSDDAGPFVAFDRSLPEPVHCLAQHPRDVDLWFAAGTTQLWRSSDGGRTWDSVPGESAGPPRSLSFERWPPFPVHVLCIPVSTVAGPDDPSPLARINDRGLLESWRTADVCRVRDPSGEITSTALTPEARTPRVLYATDRGEFVAYSPSDNTAELIFDDLPPVHALLCRSGHALDPSSSGIYSLP